MVLTCFDELCRTKNLALMRGDVISHMTQQEGQVVMEQVFESYLDETTFNKVRQFNHQP
jgi:hypothetical protein